MYKLAENGVIHPSGVFVPENINNRHWQEYLKWLEAGNEPLPADKPTAEQLAREAEINQAPITAKEYFASKQAAIDFIRLSPTEQETQIDAMTLAQLKTVVKYLTIAVSALVKREFL